jgi:arginase
MIKLLGIPFDANSSFIRGAAEAPSLIRSMDRQGSSNPTAENGRTLDFDRNLLDCGDLYFESDDPAAAFDQIYRQAAGLIQDGSRLIALGGDHSITFPVIKAHSERYPELHILLFDAHSDLYDHFDENFYSHASPFARIMEQGLVTSLTQAGIRTLCGHQSRQAERFGVKIIEMKDFSPAFVRQLKGPLYLSFDLDVLDPAFAPGVSHQEPGGMSTREVIEILRQIKVPVAGADIVEYNPKRDHNHQTAMVAYKLLKEIWSLM